MTDIVPRLEYDAATILTTEHPLATSSEHPITTAAGAADNDKAWGHLYGAIVAGLGVDPSNFQLNYPFVTWDWRVTSVGYTSAAQYDFCAAVPQFSATGAYTSAGTEFNDTYGQMLHVVATDTDDPALKEKIAQAQNELTLATNNAQIVYSQARAAYTSETGGSNDPTFTEWLGTYGGKPWATQLAAANSTVESKNRVLNELLAQTSTPGLNDAIARMDNKDYYTKLQDPSLSGFPSVPGYSIGMDSTTWLRKVQAGTGGSSGQISFSNSQAAYDYSKTWAGGSASVGNFFWSVNIGGSWERIDEFGSDSSLEVTVSFKAWDSISIEAGRWYNGAFTRSVAQGPFVPGFTPDGAGGTKSVWGKDGIMSAQKVGMVVCYKPSFAIKVSQSSFKSFSEKWEVSAGLRIGPFTFSGGGGSTSSGWKSDSATSTFTGESTAETALIIGTNIVLINPA